MGLHSLGRVLNDLCLTMQETAALSDILRPVTKKLFDSEDQYLLVTGTLYKWADSQSGNTDAVLVSMQNAIDQLKSRMISLNWLSHFFSVARYQEFESRRARTGHRDSAGNRAAVCTSNMCKYPLSF